MAMAITFLRFLCAALLLAVAALAWWRQDLAAQVRQLEVHWAQKVTAPSALRAGQLRQELTRQGAQITPLGNRLTQVQFQGSSDKAVALVNRLANAPYAWQGWSCQKLARGQIKNTVLVENL